MKKITNIIMIFGLLTILLSTPVSARNYTFTSGADSKSVFDTPTQTDAVVSQSLNENVRNNKDATLAPPPYGVFSGDIPTDALSPYHSQSGSTTGATGAVSASGVTYSDFPSSGGGAASSMPPSSELTQFSDGEILPSTSFYSGENIKVTPIYYDDGSIGTLQFPRFNRSIKVYYGETEANMLRGAGLFVSTSAWDGNCSFAAHNRGVQHNFGFLKDINIGDKVVYTTLYGTRTYEVISKKQVNETDTSGLAYSSENILSLYTCVEGVAGKRWLVVARQI